MAATKLIIFLCVGGFFTYAQVPDIRHSDLNLSDAKSDAIAYLAQLNTSLEQAKAVALTQVDGLLQLLDNTGIAIIADTKENLDAEIKPCMKAIQELENEATEAGVNITDCIGTNVDDIIELPVQFLREVSLCVDSKLKASKEYINQTVMDVDSTFDIVADLGDQINLCENESTVKQVECFTNVTANITENIATLPVQIIYDGVQLRAYVYSAIPQIALCTAGVVDDLDEEGAAIIANVTVCALEKINGTTIEILDISI